MRKEGIAPRMGPNTGMMLVIPTKVAISRLYEDTFSTVISRNTWMATSRESISVPLIYPPKDESTKRATEIR